MLHRFFDFWRRELHNYLLKLEVAHGCCSPLCYQVSLGGRFSLRKRPSAVEQNQPFSSRTIQAPPPIFELSSQDDPTLHLTKDEGGFCHFPGKMNANNEVGWRRFQVKSAMVWLVSPYKQFISYVLPFVFLFLPDFECI